MAVNLLYPPGSFLSPEVLTSFVLPAHNQRVIYAPLRGMPHGDNSCRLLAHSLYFLITDSLPVSALFNGRYLLHSALFSDCPDESLLIAACFAYAACR